MGKLYEDIKTGLEEAISFHRGEKAAKSTTYYIMPLKDYTNKEVKAIRENAGMTQTVFAKYMGVSNKTVEAWERGSSHPTGTAMRLLEILSANPEIVVPFLRIVK